MSEPQAIRRSVQRFVRRPNSVGVYWLSEDGGKTWMPAVVFKFRGRYWARDFLKVWPVANHREKTWGPKIEPPNPTGHAPARSAAEGR